ncbi:MAG TPA: DUF6588 family protein [Bacteroidota bacterium]|nr:DUF6588 family protein [Bacteroidota bacterium]
MDTLRQLPRLRSLAAAACTLIFLAATGHSQSLESTLQQFGADAVKGYIQPAGDLFGANMNAGMFHSAEISKMGFHLSLDIIGMASMVGDAQKTYTANAPPGFNPSTFQTATIFGGKAGVVTDANTGFTYHGTVDGMVDTKFVPLAAPQLTIGDVYGTRAIIRFIATPNVDNFPKATLWGIGVQHSISQYFPVIPLDVAGHVFFNKFTFGDLINFSGTSIGVEASKSFSILRVYGGLAWEKSTMEVKYVPENAAFAPVDITMNGANNFRATLGIGLHIVFFSIFADANFGSVTNYSAGIGFGG